MGRLKEVPPRFNWWFLIRGRPTTIHFEVGTPFVQPSATQYITLQHTVPQAHSQLSRPGPCAENTSRVITLHVDNLKSQLATKITMSNDLKAEFAEFLRVSENTSRVLLHG